MKDEVDEEDAGASSSGSAPENPITYGNPRASRNMAEKQRRDNLNTNISTMASLVPIVAGSSRRMDKISILRLAAAFLRTRYTLGRGAVDFLPRQYSDFDLEQYFVDHLIGSGGFFIVLTSTGKIVYVSPQVEQQLGHAQNELLGQSLYNFVYPEDHEELTRNLTPDDGYRPGVPASDSRTTETVPDENSTSSEDSTSGETDRRSFREQRRSFKLRISQRTVSRRDHTQYECLHLSGVLRLADARRNTDVNRARHREIATTNNDIVFVGMARLPNKRPLTELSIIDANKDEYVTRHLVDGRIIYCDHRISVVAGYLSEEVSGLSAFSFMHKDDLRWTIMGLRQMYDLVDPYGSSCYRLLSKTGEFIYLRTHAYLEYDKDTQTVVSFVCINTLVSEEEGVELVKEMKERYSATVSGAARAMIPNRDSSSDSGTDSQRSNSKSSLEDPSQLEDAITHLISDLPSPAVSEDRLSPSPMPNAQFAKAAIFSQRLPPAATQASKIGIKRIDHYLVLQGKGNRTPKHESIRTDLRSTHKPIMERNQSHQIPIPAPFSSTSHSSNSSFSYSLSVHESVKTERTHEIDLEQQTNNSRNNPGNSLRTYAFASPEFDNERNISLPAHGMGVEVPTGLTSIPTMPMNASGMPINSSIISTMSSVSSERTTYSNFIDNRVDSSTPVPSLNVNNMNETINDAIVRTTMANMVQDTNSMEVTNERGTNLERAIEILSQLEKREMTFVDNRVNAVTNLTNVSPSCDFKASSTKRVHNEERGADVSTSRVKRRLVTSEPCDASADSASIEPNDDVHRCLDEDELSRLSSRVDFNHGASYERARAQPVTNVAEVATNSLNLQEHQVDLDIDLDYRQLDPNIVTSNVDEEQRFDAELQDLRDDTSLSPGLDANPDLVTKILDDLRPVRLSFEKSFDETKMQQLVASDRAVDDEIRRTHLRLANSMAMRESQFSVLARDLEDPALEAQRENLTQLQAEHKMQKQMLKTLQQDHRNMQVNVKHNVGV